MIVKLVLSRHISSLLEHILSGTSFGCESKKEALTTTNYTNNLQANFLEDILFTKNNPSLLVDTNSNLQVSLELGIRIVGNLIFNGLSPINNSLFLYTFSKPILPSFHFLSKKQGVEC